MFVDQWTIYNESISFDTNTTDPTVNTTTFTPALPAWQRLQYNEDMQLYVCVPDKYVLKSVFLPTGTPSTISP
jgi:hypothetical protein